MDKNKENDKAQKQKSPEEKNEPEVFEPVEVKEAASEEKEATVQEEKTAEPEKENKETENIELLKQQLTDMNDRYIRLMAEFDNYKKRISREYERQVESANEKLMKEMIEVRENFERALRSGESGADFNVLFEGMKLIFGKFDTVLKNNGLESFAAVGEPFDPQIHDALMKTPKQDIPEDHIADIYERGYKIKSKVIKHAKVIVSSGAPASPDKKIESENKDSK
jgi:molecular chaperone GrpE